MQIKPGSIVLFFLFLACVARGTPSETQTEVALSIGRTFVWPVSTGAHVSVSNGAVVRAVDQGKFLKLTALKIGTSVIRSGGKTLEISVIPEASFRIYEVLKSTIEPMRGLRLSLESGKLQVTGRLLRWSDWVAIAEATRGFESDSFLFTAIPDEDIKREVAANLKKVVSEAGLSEIDLRFSPTIAAYVSATPADLKARSATALRGFGIPVRESSGAIHIAPLIRVQIVVAEVKKSMMSKIGIDWPGHIGGQILPTAQWEPFSMNLNAVEQSGAGKILASPTLLCRSGKEAEFLAGGEFPIKVSSLKTHELQWKKYGVVLKIKPLADSAGRMSIAIETEVSMIDTSQTVEGIPGLLTNRIETHFDLTGSRTIALSGLIKKEWGEARQGLPGLGGLPIIGPLFSSRDYRDNLSELVIFVTPKVVSSETGDDF